VPRLISSGPAIAARSTLRQHPRMQRAVVRALSFGRSGAEYEQSFRSAMLAQVRPGDCVWDVGANVGLYSELFAAAVGPSGKVISFEPSPACVALLEERIRDRDGGASWEIAPVALSDRDGEAWLSVGSGDTAPDNHLVSPGEAGTVRVRTARGDSLIAARRDAPAVIKIDVEGFDGEVLDGLGSVLDSPSLRAICLEVHFGILTQRGKPHEPARIVRLLQDHAFTVKWVDRSHLVAGR
jgi:FkbM family methyltransferase